MGGVCSFQRRKDDKQGLELSRCKKETLGSRMLFSSSPLQKPCDTAEVRVFNYTGVPLQVTVVHPSARAAGMVLKHIAPWSLDHVKLQISAFKGHRLEVNQYANARDRINVVMDHTLLRKRKMIRVEVFPIHFKCAGFRKFQSYHIRLLNRGEHPSEVMDPEIWSKIPQDVILHKILTLMPSFSRVEWALVSREFQRQVNNISSTVCHGRQASWVFLRAEHESSSWNFMDFWLAWCPSTGMLYQFNYQPKVVFTTMVSSLNCTWLQDRSRALQKAPLLVEVGKRLHEVYLREWNSRSGNQIWLRFDSEPWECSQGQLRLLSCFKARMYQDGEETPILVAAMVSQSQLVQWLGIWELDACSGFWETVTILSAETEPHIWKNSAMEVPYTSMEAGISGSLVTIAFWNRYLSAFRWLPPVVYHLPSRSWKAFPCHLDENVTLRYCSGLEASIEGLIQLR